jgi:hypothetical protein
VDNVNSIFFPGRGATPYCRGTDSPFGDECDEVNEHPSRWLHTKADVYDPVEICPTKDCNCCTQHTPPRQCWGWDIYGRVAHTENILFTGGRSLAGSHALFQIGLWPDQTGKLEHKRSHALLGSIGPLTPLAPSSIKILGKELPPSLRLLPILPEGIRLSVSPQFDPADYTERPIVYYHLAFKHQVVDLVLNNEPEWTEENPGLNICNPWDTTGLIATGMIQFKWPLTGQMGWWQILYSPAYFKVETLVPDPLVPGQIYGPIQLDKSFDILVEAKQPALRRNITVKFLPLGQKKWLEDRVVVTFGYDPDCPCQEKPSLIPVWVPGFEIWRSPWESLKIRFPNLQYCRVCMEVAQNDPAYNCYAWAAGITTNFFGDGDQLVDRNNVAIKDPNGNPYPAHPKSPEYLDRFYHAWNIATNSVAYYVEINNPGHVYHVAKVLSNNVEGCNASSKLAGDERITHNLNELINSGKMILRRNQSP